jgi:lipase
MILNTTTYGSTNAEPVVAIHGAVANGARYRRLAEEALPSRRVMAVDLRGHGRSGWLPPWDIRQHVEDVVETLDAFGYERVDVIGHSLGGNVGIHLAIAVPNRVERLVLLDPAIGVDPALTQDMVDEFLADESWVSPEEALAARTAEAPPEAHWGYAEDIPTRLEQGSDGRFRFAYSRGAAVTAASECARPFPSLKGFPGRVLVVAGLRSGFVGAPQRSWFERELGDRLSFIGLDCDHLVYWEAFEETAEAVSEFLAERRPS